MLRTFKMTALATFFAATCSAAFAEAAPSCPGGGTATGTFTCTGPVLRPVCTEGPPWKCTIKDDDKKAEMGGGGGGGRPSRHLNLFQQSGMLLAD